MACQRELEVRVEGRDWHHACALVLLGTPDTTISHQLQVSLASNLKVVARKLEI